MSSRASLKSRVRRRLTTKPGVSFTNTAVFPRAPARANAASTTSGLVRSARTISTSGSTATGLKKWKPISRSGWRSLAPWAAIESDDGVGEQDRVIRHDPLDRLPDVPLDHEVLEDRLDDDVAVGVVGDRGGPRDERRDPAAVGRRDVPALHRPVELPRDPAERQVDSLLGEVGDEGGRVEALREHEGELGGHEPAADHPDLRGGRAGAAGTAAFACGLHGEERVDAGAALVAVQEAAERGDGLGFDRVGSAAEPSRRAVDVAVGVNGRTGRGLRLPAREKFKRPGHGRDATRDALLDGVRNRVRVPGSCSHGHAVRAVAGQYVRGPGQGAAHEVRVLHEHVRDCPVTGIASGEVASRERVRDGDVGGGGGADELAERGETTPARNETESHFGQPDVACGCGNAAVVGAEREFEGAAEGGAIEEGEGGNGDPADLVERRVAFAGEAFPVGNRARGPERAEVRTGTERAPGAREGDGVHLVRVDRAHGVPEGRKRVRGPGDEFTAWRGEGHEGDRATGNRVAADVDLGGCPHYRSFTVLLRAHRTGNVYRCI